MKIAANTNQIALAFASFALAASDAKQSSSERHVAMSKMTSPLFSEVVTLAFTGKDARNMSLQGSNRETIDSLMKAINPPLRSALNKVFEMSENERKIIATAAKGLLADEGSRSKSIHGALRAVMANKPEPLARSYLDDARAVSEGFKNVKEWRAYHEAISAAAMANQANTPREPEIELVQAFRQEGVQGVQAWLAQQVQAHPLAQAI